jgi:hypothetical protein
MVHPEMGVVMRRAVLCLGYAGILAIASMGPAIAADWVTGGGPAPDVRSSAALGLSLKQSSPSSLDLAFPWRGYSDAKVARCVGGLEIACAIEWGILQFTRSLV